MEDIVLTIALLQLTSCGNDLQANLIKGEAACRQAKALGADIALFPEMWSAGYGAAVSLDPSPGDLWRAPHLWPEDRSPRMTVETLGSIWAGLAIPRDHPFIQHFQHLARELDMAIALTYLEAWHPLPRNSMSLIDRHGQMVMTYAKVHTCDFDVHECSLTPGDGFHVCVLDTAAGEVKVGAMICYDREFPESARVLMLKGAEILLTPNACTLNEVRLTQFRLRAYENQLGVAMANYAAPQDNGHSCAFDPIIFPQGDGPTRDTLIIEAGEQEGVFLAPFDLEALRDYRSREAWGNAFRKPSRYGALVSSEVEEPFIRVNSSGDAYHRTRSDAGRNG
jgi:N-carbamoylputrescine amidase